ncbi:cysteine hydrolase family protein [Piscinibacter terrae]|uniref:Isochorismatase family protein n=1 Tax=Piscinibacter terrae TaxID=2496871 RepID=A0A3N7HK66_9BURK|nr:isochorismatase family protein [Albitalea terrae]RQP22478.1 isochorismatase family protein [Albitalea terrae]
MKRKIQLLIIDPQNDFCDLPEAYRPADPVTGAKVAPALPVAGAHADMQRTAELIRQGGAGLTDIAITLDSHHRFDIAHPTFWKTGQGAAVTPFTQITAAQVRSGEYLPRDPSALPRTLSYLDALEARGRYTLMVWPVHCEIGSWGHNVHADVRAAYNAWEERQLGVVQKVNKGSNPWTEHYSALLAEVPDAEDPDTQLNQALIDQLDQADTLLITGEASSHCVKATTEHIVQNLPGGRLERIVLLTDCMSPVGGFEAQHAAFLADMRGKGVQLATTADVLPSLIANATR